ncbi:LOW QUALITY PROTEIN: retinal guanylyl cyclase 2-like [Gigantopelta aegis]|uniref:LOW QUALITY PROTEIN: retinal guanylyl cyclase 2-like n=1 Tax=Gigantopelta aegis TaxID=1735272 RepID=UPI001B8893F7|nr:LOW QUALITY PROTEIN: retinal guanylyl cyclase 2-like [Gigantopelta aegis]
MFVRRHVVKKEMTRGPNKILLQPTDLTFLLKKDIGKGSRSGVILDKPDILRGSEPNKSLPSLHDLSDYTEIARYNGDLVHVKELKIKGFEIKSKTMTQIRTLRDLRHENINPYMGLLVDPVHSAIVCEYCNRGSLEDVINNEDIKLDWDFKFSLLSDLVRGLRYIHQSTIKCHGNLKSRNCVIDSRWQLRLTDYGLPCFLTTAKQVRDLQTRDLLWTAPEHLRDPVLQAKGSEKGDIFALGIILQETAQRTPPYSSSDLSYDEILAKVKKPPPLIRPSVSPQAAPPIYIQVMKQCWSEIPDMRPTIVEVYEQFKKLTGGKKANIVDTMFRMLEKYSNDLEDIVADRTNQLEEEKKKTNQLLYRMLPPIVADNLKTGQRVEAESFNEVTIYFSDIVGFTTISAMSTPMQVVDLLNDLYTMFDATIDIYDVYKVETIGDAYMVSSGLPVRNGNRHAGEVGTMALDLLSQCGKFTIRHMSEVPLRVRIGLHTGSAVAGVVGLTMPRYCLFGDTVNTASRMESTGLPFRIHISQQCKDILDILGGYHVLYRGQVELKGKGHHSTYWLVGKEGFTKELPVPPEPVGDNHGLAYLMPNVTKPSANPPSSPVPGRLPDQANSSSNPLGATPQPQQQPNPELESSKSPPQRQSKPEPTAAKSTAVSLQQPAAKSESLSSRTPDSKQRATKSPVPDEQHHYRRNAGGGTSRHSLANKSLKKKSPEGSEVGSESSKHGDTVQELEMSSKNGTCRNNEKDSQETVIDHKEDKNQSQETVIDRKEDKKEAHGTVVISKDGSLSSTNEPSNGAAGSAKSPRTKPRNNRDGLETDFNVNDDGVHKSVTQKDGEDKTKVHVKNARNNDTRVKSSNGVHCDSVNSGDRLTDNKHACDDSEKERKAKHEENEKERKMKSSDSESNERTNVSVVSASDVVITGDDVICDQETFQKDALTPVEET